MNEKKMKPPKRKEPKLADSPDTAPAPLDDIVSFTIRVPRSLKTDIERRALDRGGATLQDEVSRALRLYLDETPEKINALSPFPDARPDEISLLRTFLAMSRSEDREVREVLRGLAGFFKLAAGRSKILAA